MINPVIIKLEKAALLKDKTNQVLLILFFALCVYAVLQGSAQRRTSLAEQDNFLTEEEQKATAWRDQIVALEEGRTSLEDDPYIGLAMRVSFPAVKRTAPLQDLAAGVTDVKPSFAAISQWRSIEQQFDRYQYQSPIGTAAGAFDMVFVIVFVMPFVLILLSYDVLADDKDRGRLDLLLAQPFTEKQLVATRLVFRSFLVLACVLASILLAALIGGQGDDNRLPYILQFFALTLAYLLFWVGVMYWVSSWRKTSETTVVVLIGFWVLNCVVGPAILSATAQTLYPAPSRLDALNEARTVANDVYQAKADVMKGMLMDHPDLSLDDYSLPEFIRTNYVITRSVDEAIKPALDRFDSVQQQRLGFLKLFQYLSPAALTMQSLNQVAGTDLHSYLDYERSVRSYKMSLSEALSQPILAGRRVTVEEYDGLPKFKTDDEPMGWGAMKIIIPAGFLVLFALVLLVLGSKSLSTRHKEANVIA